MIKYLEPNENYWICDIEADSLTPTVIWCIVLKHIFSGETICYKENECYEKFPKWLANNPEAVLVGHNFLSFDGPELVRLLGAPISLDRIVDTLVLSYLYFPAIPGGHSLREWGDRFKFPKGDFKDFDHFSEEMLAYCIQDVELTERVYLELVKRMKKRGFSERSCKLEHDIRVVVDEQQRNGFYFDVDAAKKLLDRLRGLEDDYGQRIKELFKPVLKPKGKYAFRTKCDGVPYASYARHLEQYDKLEFNDDETEYTVYQYETFNIGSPKQRVERLLDLGWEPVSFTKKTAKGGGGNPKVDEESLIAFANVSEHKDEILAIADWLVVNGRANMINTWLTNVNREDSRIHGKVFTCGAGNRRMTHSAPNTANIPKAKDKVKYGKECRRLWKCAPGRELVGYDASSLEMAMLAHYLDNDEAAELILHGDPHLRNTRALGLNDEFRDLTVKNGYYAFIYGAYPPRLGVTVDPSLSGKAAAEFGKFVQQTFIKETPGLEKLIKQIEREFDENGGFLRCLDGGFVRCPSKHAALNYKLSSAGAIVMKQTSIFAHQRIKERKLDALKVGDIHDEGQLDVAKGQGAEVGELCVQSIRDAGEALGLRVKLNGNYKIGQSWAETH